MDLVAEEVLRGHLGGVLGGGVREEVAEVGVVAVAHRGLEGDGLLRHLEDRADAIGRDAHLGGNLLGDGLAAELLHEALLRAYEPVDRLDHVDRDADRAGLVGDGAGGGLADPPGGVGGELVAAAVLELLDRLHEAGVALLDEVQEREAAVHVLLHDRDDEAQVRLDHLGAGGVALVEGGAERGELGAQHVVHRRADELVERHALAGGALGLAEEGERLVGEVDGREAAALDGIDRGELLLDRRLDALVLRAALRLLEDAVQLPVVEAPVGEVLVVARGGELGEDVVGGGAGGDAGERLDLLLLEGELDDDVEELVVVLVEAADEGGDLPRDLGLLGGPASLRAKG